MLYFIYLHFIFKTIIYFCYIFTFLHIMLYFTLHVIQVKIMGDGIGLAVLHL